MIPNRNRRAAQLRHSCIMLSLAGLILSSCAKPDAALPRTRSEQTDSGKTPSSSGIEAQSEAIPSEVSDALIPELNLRPDTVAEVAEPRFDVTVDRASARQFFMSLVEGTPYSLALAPGVSGEISLSLRDVTVEEVLDTLQQAYGYGYEKTRTGFLVLPAGLRTRVFHLDYLNLERTGTSDTRVSSGQISDQVGGAAGGVGGQATSTGEGSEGSVSGSRIQTKSESNLWLEVVESIQAIVGDGEGRSVVSSPNAGLLVVRAYPDEQAKVAKYLRWAETNLNRVVILEAKILEVTLDDGFQSGINWAQMATHNNKSAVVGQSGGGSALDSGFSESRGAAQALGPPLGAKHLERAVAVIDFAAKQLALAGAAGALAATVLEHQPVGQCAIENAGVGAQRIR